MFFVKCLTFLILYSFSGVIPAAVKTYCYTDASGIKRIVMIKKNKNYTPCLNSLALTPEIIRATKKMMIHTAHNANSKRSLPLAKRPHPELMSIYYYINKYARQHNIDPRLIYSVISVESGFNPNSVSPAGAVGLMQLMPETAKELAKNDGWRLQRQHLLDPEINISLGSKYLAKLSARFENNLELTLAAYNAGMGNVTKYNNQVPPFRETQRYVKNVIEIYKPD